MKHLKERLKKILLRIMDLFFKVLIFGSFYVSSVSSSAKFGNRALGYFFWGFFLILVSSILLVFYLIREARSPETPKWSKLFDSSSDLCRHRFHPARRLLACWRTVMWYAGPPSQQALCCKKSIPVSGGVSL